MISGSEKSIDRDEGIYGLSPRGIDNPTASRLPLPPPPPILLPLPTRVLTMAAAAAVLASSVEFRLAIISGCCCINEEALLDPNPPPMLTLLPIPMLHIRFLEWYDPADDDEAQELLSAITEGLIPPLPLPLPEEVVGIAENG
jgi:hypothetical protein